MQAAQQEFDQQLARVLEQIANRLAGEAPQSEIRLHASFRPSEESPGLETFLLLARRSEQLISELDSAVAKNAAALPVASSLDSPV